jgi:hypothetical protein
MPSAVKISDQLLALAKEQGAGAHRSATEQIEHWATLGRGVEALISHADALALKRAGAAFPIPAQISRKDTHALLSALAEDHNRERAQARIRAAGMPVYAADPEHPGRVIEVRADGTRVPGRLEGRQFVADEVHARTATDEPRRSTERESPIKPRSLLDVVDADNSGAKKVQCIRVMGGANKRLRLARRHGDRGREGSGA